MEFQEVNELRAQVQELQVQLSNQRLLLSEAETERDQLHVDLARKKHKIEQLEQQQQHTPTPKSPRTPRTPRTPSAGGDSLAITSSHARSGSKSFSFEESGGGDDVRSLTQRVHELSSLLESAKSEKQMLETELKTVRLSLRTEMKERQRQRAKMDKLNKTYVELKQSTEVMQRDTEASRSVSQELEQALSAAKAECADLKRQVHDLEERAKLFGSLERLKDEAEEREERLRKQLEMVAADASKQQHELQNALQESRQLLEEVKLEYETFVQTSRLEADVAAHEHEVRLSTLREEYENFRLRQFETTQELVREQEEITRAMQNQFADYRETAEKLFQQEAKKMNEKLQAQMRHHEEQICYVVRVKEAEYRETVTAKDAKIMNLIEGTNVQRVLVKHELEMEQLKKQCARDVEMAKQLAQSAQRKYVAELMKHITEQEQEIENLNNQLATSERNLEECRESISGLKKQVEAAEQHHEQDMHEQQRLLQQAQEQIRAVSRSKDHLRHKLLRMRLKLKGQADDSMESIAVRLAHESHALSHKLDEITTRDGERSEHVETLQQQLRRSEERTGSLERKVKQQAQELKNLSEALEHALRVRLDATAEALAPAASSPVRGGPSLMVSSTRTEASPPSSVPAASSRNPEENTLTVDDPQVRRIFERISTPALVTLFQERISQEHSEAGKSAAAAAAAAKASARRKRVPKNVKAFRPTPGVSEDALEEEKQHRSDVLQQIAQGYQRLEEFKSMTWMAKHGKARKRRGRGAASTPDPVALSGARKLSSRLFYDPRTGATYEQREGLVDDSQGLMRDADTQQHDVLFTSTGEPPQPRPPHTPEPKTTHETTRRGRNQRQIQTQADGLARSQPVTQSERPRLLARQRLQRRRTAARKVRKPPHVATPVRLTAVGVRQNQASGTKRSTS